MRKMVVLVASVVTAMLLASSWLLLPGVARPAEAELAGAGPFTEDGKIAFVNYSPDGLEIQTLNSDGTDRSSFTPPISNASKPTWSPDGTKLALVKPTGAEPDFVIARADGTGLTSVPHACDFVEQQRGSVYWRSHCMEDPLAWSPDGSKIAYIVRATLEEEYCNYSLYGSYCGRHTIANYYDIFTINVDGTERTNVTHSFPSNYDPETDGIPSEQEFSEEFSNPSWSPDGSKLVFTTVEYLSDSNVDIEIQMVKADGTGQPTALPTPAYGECPAWSPDGSKIAFAANGDLHVMNPDGSEQRDVTTDGYAQDGHSLGDGCPEWSPDGSRLVFWGIWNNLDVFPEDPCATPSSCGVDLFTIKVDGSEKTNITNSPEHENFAFGLSWQPNSAPVVTPMRPAPGSTITNRTPRILARVTDVQDNLSAADITLSIDDLVIESTAISYDPSTDRLSYRPTKNLPYGGHTVRVVAKDTSEVDTTKAWRFRVVRSG